MPPRLGRTSLRQRALSGVKWTSASALLSSLLGMAQTLIGAHLLSPRAFGLMAAVMVVVGLAQVFRDMGITNAIVVRPELGREQLSSLYWANFLSGLVVALLVLAATPLLVAYYRQPAIASLMPWVALTFALAPVGNIPGALLQRRLRFDLLARVDVVSAAVSLPVTVAAALAGEGAVSLALGYLATSVTRAVLLSLLGRSEFRPLLRMRRADLSGYLSFGGYQMGFGALDYLRWNVDYLMIGRFLGPHTLGVYAIAYSLVTRPQMQINPVLTRVATPVFAKRQDDDAALRRGYLEMLRLIAFVTMPLLAGLAVVAPQIVPLVFGPRWGASVAPLEVLAFVGICLSLGNPLGSLTLAKNRPDIEFKLTLVLLPATALAVFGAVHLGVSAVAAALLVLLLATLPVLLAVLHRLVAMPARDFFAALAEPAGMTVAMVAVALSLQHLAGGEPPAVTLGLATAGGALTYLGLLVRRQRPYLRELWAMVSARGASALA